MWAQYKKTFKRMQIVIAIVSIAAWVLTRQWQPALLLFVVMQFCALYGAIWGARLRGIMQRRQQRLPLHGSL